jgi:cobalt-zinc-cadmium efflux system protein
MKRGHGRAASHPELEGWNLARCSRRGLTLAFFGVEGVGGLLSGSLALLADAAHMFTDVGALILARFPP